MRVLFNPRCSKCRDLRQVFEARGIVWEPVLYLEGVLDRKLVQQVFDEYDGHWHDLIRAKEKTFKELELSLKTLTKAEAIEQIIANPVLIQRPIVLKDGKATIARDEANLKKTLG